MKKGDMNFFTEKSSCIVHSLPKKFVSPVSFWGNLPFPEPSAIKVYSLRKGLCPLCIRASCPLLSYEVLS